MKILSHAAAALVAALFSQAATASCYVVYGPDKDIVYRAPEPPVDMSHQIHEVLPLVAPNSTMVFTPDQHNCDVPINKLPLAWVVPTTGGTMGMRAARPDRG